MKLTALDLCLWAAGLGAHFVLIQVLWFRHRISQLPYFFTFIAANILRTVVLYLVLRHGSWQAYNVSYWIMAIADTILQFLVLYELAVNVFRPMGYWAPDVRLGASMLMKISVLVGTALTWLAAPHTTSWRDAFVIKGSFLFSCVTSELLVCMVVLSVKAGLPWKTHPARVAQGLGIYSMLDVLIEAAHSYYGQAYSSHFDDALNHTRMFVYLAIVAYWCVALWKEAPRPQALPAEVRRQLLLLQEWVPSQSRKFRSWRH